MKLGIIGQTGQLGCALEAECGHQDIEAVFYNRQALDMGAAPEMTEQFLSKIPRFDTIIIAAAYTNVDGAETEESLADLVNFRTPQIIAQYCEDKDIPLIYVSTDYVFNGTHTSPYTPEERPNPINAYGRSKDKGERAVQAACKRAAVLRTSWVFDGFSKNFLTTMLRLAETRQELSVVSDQIGRPTYAPHLAQAVIHTASRLIEDQDAGLSGIYHCTGSGPVVSWADYARYIFTCAKSSLKHSVKVTDIPSEAFPTIAQRPKYSVMSLTKFEKSFSYTLKDWREGLESAVNIWEGQTL